MGSAFHQLCPRYSGTLTPTAPTAIRLWDTFTFTFFFTKFASLNVCGLKRKVLFPEFSSLVSNYDVFSVCETKLDKYDLTDLPDYIFIFQWNPGPLTYESGALPIALRRPAEKDRFFTHRFDFDKAMISIFNVASILDRCKLPKQPISQNKVFNNEGNKLIDICKSNNLFILNGRWGTAIY